MKTRKRFLPSLVGAIALAVVAEPAMTAEWVFSEGLLLSEAYTDNVYLSETDTEGRWMTIVSPHFVLTGQGRRMSMELAAAFQFASNTEENFYPQVRGSLTSELIEKRFFVDAFVNADQVTIDPLKPAGSPINATGNLATTYSVGFNPYWVEHFGSFADLRLDYDYQRKFFTGGDNTPNDREFNNFYFDLASGRAFSIFDWSLYGSYQHTSYQGNSGSNTTFKSLNARLGYALTRHLSPYVTLGREWNSYQTTGRRRGGDMWLVGAVWTPNPRVTLDAGYGYRFFGHYPYVDFTYRHRRSTLRLSYTEDIGSGYQPLDQSGLLPTTNLAGNPVNPFSGSPGAVNAAQNVDAFNYDGAYVDKRFKAAYLLQGKRTSFGLDASYSDKTYGDGTPGLLEWILGLRLSRQLGRQLSADARTSWERTETDDGFRADTWDLGFGVTRQLGPSTHLRFSYTHAQRDSNRPNDDYTENRFALVLNVPLTGLAKHAGF